MRKLLLLFALVCSTVSAFADPDSSLLASKMIKKDLFMNQDKIEEVSQDLTQSEKMTLYDEYQKDPLVPTLVNLIVGAGIGSFIQGDTAGGAIGLACDAVGFASCFGAGLIGLSQRMDLTDLAIGLAFFGQAALVGSRVFEIIRPHTYSCRYNAVLKKSLNYLELSIELPKEHNFAGLSLSITKNLN